MLRPLSRPSLPSLPSLPILLAASLATLTACGNGAPGSETSAGDEATAVDGPLQVVSPLEVHSLEPAQAGGAFTRLEVAETLVGADPDGTLQPALAEAWSVADDERTWRFELREGATFHDGEPVTAGAVVAALDGVTDQEDSPLSSAPVAGLDASGEGVLEITLDTPYAPLPAVLAHTSTQILAPSAYGEDGSVTEVVGSGPYEVTRVRLPDTIELATAGTWDGDPPGMDEIVYAAVGRAETRASMAESGQADVTFGMEPASVERLRGSDAVEVVSVTLPRTIQLKLDGADPALGDLRVRQALSAALDREGMASALLRDPEMAATQLFPPSLDGWHQADIAPLEHDPERARELLDEAGFDTDDDGVRSRDGDRLELTLLTFTDRPELPTLATAIQSGLADVGVDLEVAIGNSSDIPAGHEDGSLDLALYARNFALTPDPLATLLDDFDPAGADWGAMNWSDDELDDLLTTMASDAEAADADEARGRVATILQEELPVVPVAWYRQSAVVTPGLTGFVLDPLERDWALSSVSWSGA